jgi:hypothetical protein
MSRHRGTLDALVRGVCAGVQQSGQLGRLPALTVVQNDR